MKKHFLLIVFAFGLTYSFSQNTVKKGLNDSIQSYLEQTIKVNNLPGLNFSIIHNNGTQQNYTVGLSDVENEISLSTKNTLFSGSIGKTYAATLVFQLVESGKKDLSKKYLEYFPDLEWLTNLPNINDITVEMLLQHTSGLPRYVLKLDIWEELHNNPDKIWTYEERLSVIFGDKAVHEAGKSWAYSDTNYILLGMLIEKVSGKNYYDLVKSVIIDPFELHETHFSLTREIPKLAIGYSRFPPAYHVPNKTVNGGLYFMNPQLEWTGGGMASTTSDLAKWAKIYYEGQLVSKNSLQSITTPNPNGKNVEGTNSYGMGSFIYASKHGNAFGHTGFMPGFNSLFIYYPDLKVAAALQFNCDYAAGVINMNELMDTLISIHNQVKR